MARSKLLSTGVKRSARIAAVPAGLLTVPGSESCCQAQVPGTGFVQVFPPVQSASRLQRAFVTVHRPLHSSPPAQATPGVNPPEQVPPKVPVPEPVRRTTFSGTVSVRTNPMSSVPSPFRSAEVRELGLLIGFTRNEGVEVKPPDPLP